VIHRREFISAVGVGLLGAPLAAETQQARRVYPLGMLYPTMPFPPADHRLTIRPSLRLREDRGIEWRARTCLGRTAAFR